MASTQENHPQGTPIASDHITSSQLDPKDVSAGSPTVRFASATEEIEPKSVEALDAEPPQNIFGQDEERLKELSKSLHGTHLQERRMSHFAFEPVSLPASRVCLLSSPMLFVTGIAERGNAATMTISIPMKFIVVWEKLGSLSISLTCRHLLSHMH
ncbi:uncharacterized protein LY89DRAFT_81057 [Mollisia scopiformis]|uniref:Uncharacterized protein n=1 Tax=Mollisia scopiformis TaxID=149040 RepID=A0A194X9A7_MOLSC|nr:uncharacterized protein LY89DRAFT_81057 [Mollisia scopiformis]KUJ16367.1 hypothetical protein LY89DRAFT_81057 [Mollisia scopiformis]